MNRGVGPGSVVVSTVASQQESLVFESQLRSFCGEFACSLCECVRFLLALSHVLVFAFTGIVSGLLLPLWWNIYIVGRRVVFKLHPFLFGE